MPDSPTVLAWSAPLVALDLAIGGDRPVSMLSLRPAGAPRPVPVVAAAHGEQPLVEVTALGHGRFPGSYRRIATSL